MVDIFHTQSHGNVYHNVYDPYGLVLESGYQVFESGGMPFYVNSCCDNDCRDAMHVTIYDTYDWGEESRPSYRPILSTQWLSVSGVWTTVLDINGMEYNGYTNDNNAILIWDCPVSNNTDVGIFVFLETFDYGETPSGDVRLIMGYTDSNNYYFGNIIYIVFSTQ